MFLYIFLLVFGIFLVVKSSDYFIDYASKIGLKLNLSELFIGIFIVSVGTSLPELVTSLVSIYSIKEFSNFILGNIIGSNISNICLIFGIFLIFNKKKIKINNIDLLTLFIVTFVFVFFFYRDYLNWISGVLFLLVYVLYIAFSLKEGKLLKEFEKEIKSEKIKESNFILIMGLFISLFLLFLSSKIIVFSVENLSKIFNISPEIISLTMVAFGTSIPELSVTITSLIKKKTDIAYGNVIGSNIANIALIIGLSSILRIISLPFHMLSFSILILIISTLVFLVIKKVNKYRFIGVILLFLYVFYILFNYI